MSPGTVGATSPLWGQHVPCPQRHQLPGSRVTPQVALGTCWWPHGCSPSSAAGNGSRAAQGEHKGRGSGAPGCALTLVGQGGGRPGSGERGCDQHSPKDEAPPGKHPTAAATARRLGSATPTPWGWPRAGAGGSPQGWQPLRAVEEESRVRAGPASPVPNPARLHRCHWRCPSHPGQQDVPGRRDVPRLRWQVCTDPWQPDMTGH